MPAEQQAFREATDNTTQVHEEAHNALLADALKEVKPTLDKSIEKITGHLDNQDTTAAAKALENTLMPLSGEDYNKVLKAVNEKYPNNLKLENWNDKTGTWDDVRLYSQSDLHADYRVVQPGNTLTDYAAPYARDGGMEAMRNYMLSIMDLNDIEDPDWILRGQVLAMPNDY